MGISAGLGSLLAAGVGAVSAAHTQSANAAAQSSINKKTMEFNAKEAQKAREFEHNEASINRLFNQRSANTAMQFSSNEAEIARQFESSEALKARQYDAQQSLLARQFEERMSNTAHQREVSDLRAAGLNPVLSATGGSGASTPVAPVIGAPLPSAASASGSAASGQAAKGIAAAVGGLNAYMKKDVFSQFVNSAMDGLRLDNDIKRAKAEDISAQARMLDAQTNAKESIQRIEESISRVGLNMDQHEINSIRKMSEQELVNKLRAEITEVVTRTKDNHELSNAEKQAVLINANAYAGLASAEANLADIRGRLETAKNPAEIRKLNDEADRAKSQVEMNKWIMSDPETEERRKYISNNPQLVPIKDAINDVSKIFKVNIGAHGLFSIGGSDNGYQGTKIGF